MLSICSFPFSLVVFVRTTEVPGEDLKLALHCHTSASQLAPYSLNSALLLTRAHGYYLGNRVPLWTLTQSVISFMGSFSQEREAVLMSQYRDETETMAKREDASFLQRCEVLKKPDWINNATFVRSPCIIWSIVRESCLCLSLCLWVSLSVMWKYEHVPSCSSERCEPRLREWRQCDRSRCASTHVILLKSSHFLLYNEEQFVWRCTSQVFWDKEIDLADTEWHKAKWMGIIN